MKKPRVWVCAKTSQNHADFFIVLKKEYLISKRCFNFSSLSLKAYPWKTAAWKKRQIWQRMCFLNKKKMTITRSSTNWSCKYLCFLLYYLCSSKVLRLWPSWCLQTMKLQVLNYINQDSYILNILKSKTFVLFRWFNWSVFRGQYVKNCVIIYLQV